MISIFNRKELISVLSEQKLHRLQSALSSFGIPYQTKNSLSPLNGDRYHGTPFINQDAAHPCTIYVKKSDYERAKRAIQSALRE